MTVLAESLGSAVMIVWGGLPIVSQASLSLPIPVHRDQMMIGLELMDVSAVCMGLNGLKICWVGMFGVRGSWGCVCSWL